MLLKMSIPNTSAAPSSAGIRPVNMDKVVVLPAPLCPKSAKIYPLYMVMLVPFTATLSPNLFTSPQILRHSLFDSCLFKESGIISKFRGFLFPISSSSRSFFLSESTPGRIFYLLLLHIKFHGFATP